jgi:hypothetical protein
MFNRRWTQMNADFLRSRDCEESKMGKLPDAAGILVFLILNLLILNWSRRRSFLGLGIWNFLELGAWSLELPAVGAPGSGEGGSGRAPKQLPRR